MKKNRRLIQVLIFLGVLVLGGYAIGNSLFANSGGLPGKGQTPPSFALLDLDGQTHRLEDYKGKALVLNFWGTFCPGCVTETPDLEEQYKKHADKPFEIVGVNLSEDKLAIRNFIEQYGVSYTILQDDNRQIERAYGLRSYPTTFFVKPDGTIMDVFIGPMGKQDMDERITKLLAS
ncbi:redoxin domain-containing protein [Paenibacillus sp. MWE-103]|uniref:Redoxin domain-containing protein n=1 Tax=Paenibacillus artemisiicola TaxID=1172618 RepID=A0ABS3W6Y1_9BACL|nr:redoxin domain-containing protein [Paenibacillus artemisiicola]MBO7744050.1 redoxin domain-containing protein [Paenibacillus artemisiicola]